MNKSKLILHIGMTKTGSTAIQNFLSVNPQQLEAQKFVYVPSKGTVWPPMPEYDGWERNRVDFIEEWAPVRHALSSSSNTVIYSSEALMHAIGHNSEVLCQIQEFVGDHPVEVILYIRRQDIHAESIYKEIIKQFKAPGPFGEEAVNELCGSLFYDYYNLASLIAERVGKASLKVQVYERQHFPNGDVVLNFCHLVGISVDESFSTQTYVVNPSIDARIVDYYAVANSKWKVHNEVGQLFNQLIWYGSTSLFNDYEGKIFSLEERKTFLARYAKANQKLALEFVGNEDGVLFEPIDDEKYKFVKKLDSKGHAELALFMHQIWTEGVGAIPFMVYNYKKILYLSERIRGEKGGKKLSFCIRFCLHYLLHFLLTGERPANLYKKKNRFERKIVHYLLRSLQVKEKKDSVLL